jgi:PAS domain S-box-containing protein
MGKEANIKDTIDELNKKNIELSKLTEELKEERDRLHNALEELSEAKEFYRIMGEALPYGIWMCDAEGKARYMSQSFLDLLEMTLEQAQEFGWAHRLPPEDVDHMFEAWLECVHTGKDWDSEHRILGPDGKYHAVLTRGKPVRDKEGKIISWVGINLDIDQRKEMEAEARQKEIEIAALKANVYEEERKRAEALTELREAQLDAFFANSPAILNLVDENLCYINTDKITPTYYGLNRESIIGKSVKDLSWISLKLPAE